MLSSSVENVQIPILIPLRGKGHFETLCSCSFSSSSEFVNPADYVRFFVPYGKRTCTVDTPLQIAEEISRAFKLSTFTLEMRFSLLLDRTSPSYQETYFNLPCKYTVTCAYEDIAHYMGISLPVRVLDVHPIPGILSFAVKNPKSLFFEDLVEHVQRSVGTVIYPIGNEQDRAKLKDIIDLGKSAYEYLTALEETCVKKKLGKGGIASVRTSDVYRMYDFRYHISW